MLAARAAFSKRSPCFPAAEMNQLVGTMLPRHSVKSKMVQLKIGGFCRHANV